jgi:hypothetical protein
MAAWPHAAPANELNKMATKMPEARVFRKLSESVAQSFITGFLVDVFAREGHKAWIGIV